MKGQGGVIAIIYLIAIVIGGSLGIVHVAKSKTYPDNFYDRNDCHSRHSRYFDRVTGHGRRH